MWNKLLIAVLLVALMALPAFALEEFQYDQSKVVAGVVGSYEEKSIEDLNVLNVGIGSFLDGDLTVVTDDLKMSTILAQLGYQVSEQVTPYVLLGVGTMEFDQTLNGSLATRRFDLGADLLANEYSETDLAYGAGLMGDLLQVKGVKLGYDVRWYTTSGKEGDEDLNVLPGDASIALSNALEADYNEVDVSALLSKEIDLSKKCEEGAVCEESKVKSVTPYIGYRLSMLDMNVKGEASIDALSIANESNYRGINNDGLVGAKVKINDRLAVNLGAVIGENLGGNASVALKF